MLINDNIKYANPKSNFKGQSFILTIIPYLQSDVLKMKRN